MYLLGSLDRYSDVTLCIMENKWKHRVEELNNLIQELCSLSVWVYRRKSLSIHKYDHIGLGKKLNKIREKNNKMNIQKNRVLMLQETCNEGVANG